MLKTIRNNYFKPDDGLDIAAPIEQVPVVVEPVVDPVHDHLQKVNTSLTELHEKLAHLTGKIDGLAQTVPAPVAQPAVPTAEEVAEEVVAATEDVKENTSETAEDGVNMVFDKPRDVAPRAEDKKRRKGLARRKK